MSDQFEMIECQRCRQGFLLTPTYCDWLSRRGVEVILPVLCPTCFTKAGPVPKKLGKVKWFDTNKQYGFIVAEDGEEVFVHQQQIIEGEASEVCEGQPVAFHVRQGSKGPKALNVELVKTDGGSISGSAA
jgi:CspA family cold shock protein